jgi:hypothetical protein
VSFDIETFTSRSRPVSLEGIDLDAFRVTPLDDDALRCLRYMHDVEYHTVCYLRDLLVSPAHLDPEVTAFLTMWNMEEYFHGEAIGAVLTVHGELARADRVRTVRRSLGWRDRIQPMAHTVGSLATGMSYTAVHMAWGAINEWSAQAAYARLAQRAGHPILTELLQRIMRQEGRHADFYARQADSRLRDDRRARWLTRTMLRRYWAPVGSTLMPPNEVAFVTSYLFSGAEGEAMTARIDRRVDRLPGLAGLDLTQRTVARHVPVAV